VISYEGASSSRNRRVSPLTALCSRWLATRRMGEDAPFRTLAGPTRSRTVLRSGGAVSQSVAVQSWRNYSFSRSKSTGLLRNCMRQPGFFTGPRRLTQAPLRVCRQLRIGL